ncbi:hypothetical protein PGT21_021067 [Puccinia graminis f. sp. tritici]|uniref:Uncharacterized protein n=1 Tax=Puccinia graminis f. sp. tritici TaxID=56615 RepID=A0A5B0NS69_PUCGR|nr:hypothetical protein PGT21_021067 [Puccinia graminis f. sp. tritici]KAA1091753.1 hypothetical protein PGTUg99_010751 [Puccinia graminis f. sp. tritici]
MRMKMSSKALILIVAMGLGSDQTLASSCKDPSLTAPACKTGSGTFIKPSTAPNQKTFTCQKSTAFCCISDPLKGPTERCANANK